MCEMVSSSNNLSAFKNKLQKKSMGFNDDRYLNLKAGNTYIVRLINTQSSKRSSPFVEKWIHSVKGSDNKTIGSCVCPRTYYPESYLKKCPTCSNNGKLYNSTFPEDKKLYDIHKPKFHGYVPVYVISDPSTPENNGHVKILHFSIMVKKQFELEIFGFDKRNPKVQIDDCLMDEAFSFDNGRNLTVMVNKKTVNNREFNEHTFIFAKKATPLPINMELLAQEVKKVDVDSVIDEYKDGEAITYFNKFVIETPNAEENMDENAGVNTVVTQKLKPSIQAAPKDEIPMEFPPKQVAQTVIQPPKVQPPPVDATVISNANIKNDLDVLGGTKVVTTTQPIQPVQQEAPKDNMEFDVDAAIRDIMGN